MMSSQNPSASGLYFHWDPQNLKIRSKSVERTLEPLVTQVTTLVNFKAPSNRLKGRSRRAQALVEAIKQSTNMFVERGQEIAGDNPEIQTEMRAAIEDVRTTGQEMYDACHMFAHDPCAMDKREGMIGALRALLSAVTRLLILADMVDVYLLLRSLRAVEGDVEAIRMSNSHQELTRHFEQYGHNVMGLIDLAGMRQVDLIDPRRRDEIAAARAILKKNNTMLLTTSKTYVRHPELQEAHLNRDYAIKSVCDAVGMIHGATQDSGEMHPLFYEAPGELAAALDEFDNKILMDPYTFNDAQVRRPLEERLEEIITSAAVLADSSCTRPEHRENIIEECNRTRNSLQLLLKEYGKNAGRREPSDSLRQAMQSMLTNTTDLRRHMGKAVIDHISDSFLDASMPLQVLVKSARGGDEPRVEVLSVTFQEHANTLEEVAMLACSLCANEEGAKLVRTAGSEMKHLCSQVINAARILAVKPESKVAQENMEVFSDAWVWAVRMLIETVDDITNIGEFLVVTEAHVGKDVEQCIGGFQNRDPDRMLGKAQTIQGRSDRLCQVVSAEMANYRSNSEYVDRVMEAVVVLRDKIVPRFNRSVSDAEEALTTNRAPPTFSESGFVQSARQVYEGVREVRRAVVLERYQDGYESDYADMPLHGNRGGSQGSSIDGDHEIGAQENVVEEREARNERSLMRMLPPEQRQVLMQEMADFYEEKKKFMREMVKWDDSANDLVVIAKRMCVIMMEMTDFTRGRGPLKTTMDVIQAARRISDCGNQLDKLARQIARQCPDSASKKDLEAYLQRITLYCHQLNITSKVKADVQNVGGELVVSGLDSATSLIQAAKNLMSAVVLTVKASYIASTKYRTGDAGPVVQWRMKAPGKKPLIQKSRQDDPRVPIKGSERYNSSSEPIKELSQFDHRVDDSVA